MTWDHRTLRLPTGVVAVAAESKGGRVYQLHGSPVLLTAADVETLFADSIAGGPREPDNADICVCTHTRGVHRGELGADEDCEVCDVCHVFRLVVAVRP